MGRIALLDVNVLVALFDPEHVHHEVAHDWFADHRGHGWATCPITENGFVRVISNPAYGGGGLRPAAVAASLAEFRGSGDHTFWPAVLSLSDRRVFDLGVAAGHAQLTDVYLLGLATFMNGSLATFDRTIPLNAVIGAKNATLQIIGPDAG